MRRILYVARHQDAVPPSVFHQALSLFGILVLAIVADQHIGAFAGEGEYDGTPDPAITPGDNRLLSDKSPGSFVGGLSVVRHRIHSGGTARHWLLLIWKRWPRRIGAHADLHLQALCKRPGRSPVAFGSRWPVWVNPGETFFRRGRALFMGPRLGDPF
jgi:hypothetical protein